MNFVSQDNGIIPVPKIQGNVIVDGGNANNIIPETAVLEGTIRSNDKASRDLLVRRMKEGFKVIIGRPPQDASFYLYFHRKFPVSNDFNYKNAIQNHTQLI